MEMGKEMERERKRKKGEKTAGGKGKVMES